jgi:hypothetical protein
LRRALSALEGVCGLSQPRRCCLASFTAAPSFVIDALIFAALSFATDIGPPITGSAAVNAAVVLSASDRIFIDAGIVRSVILVGVVINILVG